MAAGTHLVQMPRFELGEEALLWAQFVGERRDGDRDQLATHYFPFARVMAAKLYAHRMHDEIAFEEYLQLACVGLMECIDRFDPERGAKFETFAAIRIHGAILNGLEVMTEKQSQIAARQRMLKERHQSLTADKTATTGQEALRQLAEIAVSMALSFMLDGSGMIADETGTGFDHAYAGLAFKQLKRQVSDAVDRLETRERNIIRMHYFQQHPFDDIAKDYGLTKGRISQLHKQAITRLGALLGRDFRLDIKG